MADKRKFLAVPYAEREAARAAGARWDATLKSWYVGKGADRSALARWLPEKAAPGVEPREEFIDDDRERAAHARAASGRGWQVAPRSRRGRQARRQWQISPSLGSLRAAPRRTSSRICPQFPQRHLCVLEKHRLPSSAARDGRVARRGRREGKGECRRTGARHRGGSGACAGSHRAARARDCADRLYARQGDPADQGRAHRCRRRHNLPSGDRYRRQTVDAADDPQGRAEAVPEKQPEGGHLPYRRRRPGGVGALGLSRGRRGLRYIGDPLRGGPPADDRRIRRRQSSGRRHRITRTLAGKADPYRRRRRSWRRATRGLQSGPREGLGRGRGSQWRYGLPRVRARRAGKRSQGFTDFHDLAVRSRVGRDGVRIQIEAALEGLIVPPAGGIAKETGMADENPIRRDPQKERDLPPQPQPVVQPDPADIPPRDPVDRAEMAGNSIVDGREPDGAGRERDAADEGRGPREATYDVGDVPPALAARYRSEQSRWLLQRDYYESNSAPRPVFHDQGRRLVTEIESPAVIADMIAIAEHRGWTTIEVAGTPEFRRDAWVRAQTVGLEVTGYRPTERDRQEVAQSQERPSPRQRQDPVADRAAPEASEPARLYLDVPFAEKETAKAAGTRWDRDARSWYAREGQEAAVKKWLPAPERTDADKLIAGDRAAREQMRTIEAVVGTTLANDPEAAKRILNAGRETLAGKIERGETIPVPAFRQERAASEPLQLVEPALSTRRPPNRTRVR